MNLVDRIKKILLQPKQEWAVIAEETTTTSDLYRNYIILLAAIGPVASIIGLSLVGVSMPFVGTFRIPIITSIVSAVVHYILSIVGVYILALIIDFLAPNFAGQKNMNQALKLAAYSYTAAWLAGIFVIIPLLGIIGFLVSLYSLYLLYLGIPPLMKAPQEKSLVYTVVVVIAAIIIGLIISFVPRAFISYPTANINIPGVTEKTTRELEKAAKDMEEATKKMQENISKMPQAGQMTPEQQKQMEEAAKKMEEAMKNMPQKQ